MYKQIIGSAVLLTLTAACVHHKVAAVLPKGGGAYEIVAQAASEQRAFSEAETEATYTCESRQKEMVVMTSDAKYQGPDKDADDGIKAENVALAFVTGNTGKERDRSSDYKVTLLIECR
jgi:hypothetical protein